MAKNVVSSSEEVEKVTIEDLEEGIRDIVHMAANDSKVFRGEARRERLARWAVMLVGSWIKSDLYVSALIIEKIISPKSIFKSDYDKQIFELVLIEGLKVKRDEISTILLELSEVSSQRVKLFIDELLEKSS